MKRKRIRESEPVVEQESSGLKRLSVGLGILAGIMVVATVVVSVSFASKGSRLMALEREIMEMERKNREIGEEIVQATSVTMLVDEVDDTGFVKPEQVEYLSTQLSHENQIAKLP